MYISAADITVAQPDAGLQTRKESSSNCASHKAVLFKWPVPGRFSGAKFRILGPAVRTCSANSPRSAVLVLEHGCGERSSYPMSKLLSHATH